MTTDAALDISDARKDHQGISNSWIKVEYWQLKNNWSQCQEILSIQEQSSFSFFVLQSSNFSLADLVSAGLTNITKSEAIKNRLLIKLNGYIYIYLALVYTKSTGHISNFWIKVTNQ